MESRIEISIVHDSSIIVPTPRGEYIPYCAKHEHSFVWNKREVLQIIREHLRDGHYIRIQAKYGELTERLLVSQDCTIFIRTDTDPQGNHLPEKVS
ncbi:MAG: hypothetical protein WA082_02010 [Candidatus Moraniibacteriota bacterium]